MEPQHLLMLKACVICLGYFCAVQAGSITDGSRRTKRSGPHSPANFLASLSNGPVDLVVILDRSEGMGRHYFYTTVRKLAAHVLKHFALLDQAKVRLAVITFAETSRVDIDGISGDRFVNKCELFNGAGNGGLWDNVTFTDENWSGTNVDAAFQTAIRLFEVGARRRHQATRLLWILTDGNYKETMDPRATREYLINDLGVAILATGLGPWLRDNVGNVRNLLRYDERYGNLTQWLEAVSKTPLITTKIPPRLQTFGGIGDVLCPNTSNAVCDVVSGRIQCLGTCNGCISIGNKNSTCSPMTCLNGGACVEGLGRPVCKCAWNGGYQGDRCDLNENECLQDACDVNGRCQDGVGTYTCACADGYCGRFCEDRDCPNEVRAETEPYIPFKTIMIAVIVGSVVMVLVIVTGIVFLCRGRRRNGTKRPVDQASTSSAVPLTESAETTTGSSDGSVVTTIQTKTVPVQDDVLSVLSETGSSPSLGTLLSSDYPGRIPPPTARPDLLETIPVSEEDPYFVNRQSYLEVFNYVNLPEHKNMGDWESYVADLTSEQGLQRATMVRLDRTAWITSDRTTFLPTNKEISDIIAILDQQTTDVSILVKKQSYRVDRNDGLMLRACRQADRLREVLCVGRTTQFLVLGLIEERTTSTPDQCFIEVDWVRNHIREQGL